MSAQRADDSSATPLADGKGRIETQLEGPIVTVTIANAGKRNALTVTMWETLQRAFCDIEEQRDVRCVVIRGASGEGFAAGADITEFDTVRKTRQQVEHFHENIVFKALAAIDRCPVPVIASIEGACLGGGLEIASVCDLRIAGRGATFGIPIHMLGFPLAPAEMQWLYGLAGPALTAELLFEGAILSADEALSKGLVTRVVDDAALLKATDASAGRVAGGAPLAARANKSQLRVLMSGARLTREQRLAIYAFAETEDYDIGVQAFRNRTTPVFKGR